jgi:hypothetical protein
MRDSVVDTSVVAGGHEQLVSYEVQDQELAFVHKALKQRSSLSIWFDAEMPWHARQASAAVSASLATRQSRFVLL